jgi:hypothetical protein
MLSEHHNPAAAKRFFRSAKTVTGVIPDRVTTEGHDAYPPAIRMELGSRVRHRTNCYRNNRLEQDHRGVKGRCRPMLGFKSAPSARRYCHGYDELQNPLRSRSRMCQHVPATTRRFHYMRRTAIALGILEAACTGGSAAREGCSEQAGKLTEPFPAIPEAAEAAEREVERKSRTSTSCVSSARRRRGYRRGRGSVTTCSPA